MIRSFRRFGVLALVLLAFTACSRSNPEGAPARTAPAIAAAKDEESPYVTELKNFFETIRNHYAPLELKRTTIGYDYEKAKSKAFADAAAMKTSGEFYGILAEFLHGLDDAHVSISLPSSLKYNLPLQFSYVENKFVLNYVDRNSLAKEKCDAKIGDELVRLNGKTPTEIQASDLVYRKNGNPRTNAAYFARMLSSMKEANGTKLKQLRFDAANLEFARPDGTIVKCQAAYEKSGLGVIDRPIPSRPLGIAALDAPFAAGSATESSGDELPEFLKNPRFLKLNSLMEKWQRLVNTDSGIATPEIPDEIPGKKKKKPNFEGKQIEIGASEPFFVLPKNFKRIRPSLVGRPIIGLASNFFAGTFERDGKRVGFLRIPSYMPPLMYLMSFGVRFYISELQQRSDVLIIDQTNNPGGAVVLSDLVVKGFTGKFDSAKHMKFRMKPTQSFLRQYADIMEVIEKDAKDGENGAGSVLSEDERKYYLGEMRKNYEIIEAAYRKDEPLSDPVSLMIMSEFFEVVIDKLAEKVPLKAAIERLIGGRVFSPQTYTKPVFMLINELDFSGGDATPAILQDYGRVKLVGVRTAGAGGTVEEFSSRVTSDVKFRLTTSLMYRKGGKYVENYGITPDVPFELTRKDYQDGFANVLDRLLNQLGI